MKNLKKLPGKQLEKFSNLFTQLGLVLVLFIVYVVLEHQTEQASVKDYSASYVPTTNFLEVNTPVLFRKEPVAVKKLKFSKKVKFIADAPIKIGANTAEDTFLNFQEDAPIVLNAGDIIVAKLPKEPIIEDVPYYMVQNAPIFKGCEGLSREQNKICFDKKMKRFVQRNFNAGLANDLGLKPGKYKIQTQFLINEHGTIANIKIRAPHNKLALETERLIKKLPRFTPGQQQNNFVRVRYTLPIAFRVD